MPTETYTTPGDHSFTVPQGVTQIEVRVYGAGGGGGGGNGTDSGQPGGDGAYLAAEYAVSENDTVDIDLAGGGGGGASGGAGGAGGENGPGGAGGSQPSNGGAGGGGGWTEVQLNSTRAIVAGAGGGGPSVGDLGSFNSGAGDGIASPNGSETLTAGEDGTDSSNDDGAGGGGGAGYEGGSGGGADIASGGGGGGSFVDSGLASTVLAQTDGGGQVGGAGGTGGGSDGEDALVEIEYLDPPNAPSDVTQDVQDDDTVEVTVTPDNPDNDPEEYEYEVSLDGGAYTAVTTTTNTTFTDTVSSSADSIQYRVRATNDAGDSAWVESGTETTNATGLTVVDTREGEIDLSWTDPSANDGTDVLLADSSGSIKADYTVAESLGASEGSTTLTGLENGETYYMRVQATYTGSDGTPAPLSNEVSTTTDPVPPTLDTLDTATLGEITVEYTLEDNSPDGDVEVERSDDGGQTFSTIATVTDLSATSYTDTTVTEGDQYTYRITRNTSDTSVQSNTLTDYAAFDPPTPQGLVLQGGGTTQILERDEITAKDLAKVHTGVGDGRINVPENDAIIPRVQRQDRVFYYVDGECEWTGYPVGYQGDQLTGEWTLRLDGIGKRLEETRPDYDALGGSLVYTNTALDSAIRDYWGRTPFSATVTDQQTELVAQDEELQSAGTTSEWGNLYSPADTDPITISSGTLALEQTCWTQEGEDASNDNVNATTGSDYSGGEGAVYLDNGDFAEWTFTPGYDIPSGEFRIFYRHDGSTGVGDIEWTVNNTTVETTNNPLQLGWNTVNADELGALSAGTQVTVRAEMVTSSSGNRVIDVVAPADNRFSYTLDNDNGGPGGYLDGPELYPVYDVTFPSVTTAYNITSATITSTWNDTTGDQAIAVSNDNGATLESSANTATDTFNFSTSGRQAITRFTLAGGGSRTTATPQTGYIGQEVQDYTLAVDLNDLVVIDRLELTRDHFANLKTLHDYGDFLWVIEHGDGDLSDLTVRSFNRGAETRTAPFAFLNPANRSPEVAAENYFNSVYLEGALQSDGTRPTAEVKDQDAINADGREITPGVLRDRNISTEAGATFRANTLLEAALENDALRGTIDTHPVYVEPGYGYSIDFGQGSEIKTLESLSITESAGDVGGTAEFVTREQLSETISNLKREGRSIGNQV